MTEFYMQRGLGFSVKILLSDHKFSAKSRKTTKRWVVSKLVEMIINTQDVPALFQKTTAHLQWVNSQRA